MSAKAWATPRSVSFRGLIQKFRLASPPLSYAESPRVWVVPSRYKFRRIIRLRRIFRLLARLQDVVTDGSASDEFCSVIRLITKFILGRIIRLRRIPYLRRIICLEYKFGHSFFTQQTEPNFEVLFSRFFVGDLHEFVSSPDSFEKVLVISLTVRLLLILQCSCSCNRI